MNMVDGEGFVKDEDVKDVKDFDKICDLILLFVSY